MGGLDQIFVRGLLHELKKMPDKYSIIEKTDIVSYIKIVGNYNFLGSMFPESEVNIVPPPREKAIFFRLKKRNKYRSLYYLTKPLSSAKGEIVILAIILGPDWA